MRDERAREDPREELDAGLLGLTFWQIAALSRGAPLAVVVFRPGLAEVASEAVLMGLLAWDDAQHVNEETADFASWLSATNNELGDDTLTFNATAEDETGTARPIAFMGAAAWPITIPTLPDTGIVMPRCEVSLPTSRSVRVKVRQQGLGTLGYSPFVLAIW